MGGESAIRFASTETCSREPPTPLPHSLSPQAATTAQHPFSLGKEWNSWLLNFSCCVCLIAAFSQRQTVLRPARRKEAVGQSTACSSQNLSLQEAAVCKDSKNQRCQQWREISSPARKREYTSTFMQRGKGQKRNKNSTFQVASVSFLKLQCGSRIPFQSLETLFFL